MGSYRQTGETVKVDPILGIPVDQIKKIYQSEPDMNKTVQTIKPTKSIGAAGSSGLGLGEGLLKEAYANAEQNKKNAYKLGGLGISKELGDITGLIMNTLLK